MLPVCPYACTLPVSFFLVSFASPSPFSTRLYPSPLLPCLPLHRFLVRLPSPPFSFLLPPSSPHTHTPPPPPLGACRSNEPSVEVEEEEPRDLGGCEFDGPDDCVQCCPAVPVFTFVHPSRAPPPPPPIRVVKKTTAAGACPPPPLSSSLHTFVCGFPAAPLLYACSTSVRACTAVVCPVGLADVFVIFGHPYASLACAALFAFVRVPLQLLCATASRF